MPLVIGRKVVSGVSTALKLSSVQWSGTETVSPAVRLNDASTTHSSGMMKTAATPSTARLASTVDTTRARTRRTPPAAGGSDVLRVEGVDDATAGGVPEEIEADGGVVGVVIRSPVAAGAGTARRTPHRRPAT